MKAELKQKWVDALRSGDYEQGKGALLASGKYCCLGVLCEVSGLRIVGPNILAGDQYESDSYSKIREMIGVDATELTMRNDGSEDVFGQPDILPHSFAEIADYIEANIPTDNHSVADASA